MANNGTAPRVESVGFDDLTPLAHRLNSSSDDLNAALRRIEARLNGLALGIETFVPIEVTREYVNEDGQPNEWHEHHLGYGRVGDSWGLLTRTAHFTDSPYISDDPDAYWEFGEEKSLLRASRDIRIHAVSAIPLLLKQLKSEACKVLSVVEEAERLADEGAPTAELPPQGGEALRVPCMVSDRALQFHPKSSELSEGEFITLDVTTAVDGVRRLCRLVVTRENLTRALAQVSVSL